MFVKQLALNDLGKKKEMAVLGSVDEVQTGQNKYTHTSLDDTNRY